MPRGGELPIFSLGKAANAKRRIERILDEMDLQRLTQERPTSRVSTMYATSTRRAYVRNDDE